MEVCGALENGLLRPVQDIIDPTMPALDLHQDELLAVVELFARG